MEVSILGFGAAEIGYEGASVETVAELLGDALDAGLNVIDTAECYATSEERIGQTVSHRRGDFFLFTKCGHASGFDLPDWEPSLLAQSIDRSLYEAAEIDGANAWQRFRFVTLPGLSSMIRLSVFFSLLGSLQVFDVIRALTFDGGPLNTTHTLVSFLYIFGVTRMRVGFGSAIGVVIFVICVVVAFSYQRLFMRND